MAAIIPVWNGGANFHRCLSSIINASPSPNELIVVVDGPDEASREIAISFGTRVLILPENRGPATARNVGARAAKSDILFFLDADVIVPPDIFENIYSIFKKNSQVHAVFGSYDDEPPGNNFFSQFKNLLHHYVHQSAKTEASTFWAGCGAVLRNRFEDVGGFNEKYRFPSVEDIEFGYRLIDAGGCIRLSRHIQVKHLKRWTFFSLIKTDFFYRGLPWSDLIFQKGFINDLNISQSGRFSVLLSWITLFSVCSFNRFGFFLIAPVCGILLIWLNRKFYYFLLSKRGFSLMLRSIPFHWFYFFYSGMAFLFSFLKFILKMNPSNKMQTRDFQKS